MPPKAATQLDVEQKRGWFRSIVDRAFDGNLSEAARILQMSVSTTHQYYTQGPRRMSNAMVLKLVSADVWLNRYERTLDELREVKAAAGKLHDSLMDALYVECEQCNRQDQGHGKRPATSSHGRCRRNSV